MTKGKPLSEKEKEYIREHKDEMLFSQIADNLGELFPELNGGNRCQATVRRFVQEEGG
jgi:hypothetical protein